ncbi:hypothetical protein B0H11DRAFT_2054661 [Mycena galericulata]|nr:hypothetical protein B0H11DRAFT_2054661 [Mycena galericulata]
MRLRSLIINFTTMIDGPPTRSRDSPIPLLAFPSCFTLVTFTLANVKTGVVSAGLLSTVPASAAGLFRSQLGSILRVSALRRLRNFGSTYHGHLPRYPHLFCPWLVAASLIQELYRRCCGRCDCNQRLAFAEEKPRATEDSHSRHIMGDKEDSKRKAL